MIIFKRAAQLSSHLHQQKIAGQPIGFVPTMGALHAGHLSLIDLSKASNAITVCSIFINPTQFTNADDFKHYPVTIEKDIELLIKAGCDILFLPSVEEMYPPHYKAQHYELGSIENILEGYYRPGHFQGVCQVVDRLLEMINPDNLYMGQKDYQQCIVIQKLINLLNKQDSIHLIIAATKREATGLAMSSRNMRLDIKAREQATAIIKTLNFIKENLSTLPLDLLKKEAYQQLAAKGFIVDYVEIAEAGTLETATHTHQGLVALIAATLGTVRLIDNIQLN